MSLVTPKLQIITDFGTGTVRETITALSAVTTEQLDGMDSAKFRVQLPTRTAITLRTPLRFRGSDNVIREYRVQRYQKDPLGKWADIDCVPVFYDLTAAGPITEVVNGTEYTAFGGTLTASQWITSYVLTNLVADGLNGWLDTTLGTIDSTQLVTLAWEQWTRAELLRAIADAIGLELVLIQVSAGGKYRIHMLDERGSTSPVIRVSQSRNLIERSVEAGADGIATVVRPRGDVPEGGTEPASIGDHIFTVQSIASGWVVLIDPTTNAPPLQIDDMANGLYLQFLSGTTAVRRIIDDSRASDGAVHLADTSLLTVAARVTLVQDTNGTPISTITHPAALATYGRVVAPLQVDGMRGEANRVPNSNFSQGASQWAGYGAGWVEPYVPSEVTDLTGAMNGVKTAGAPATLAVDGLPAGATIRRGERIEVASVLLATVNGTEKVVPSTGNVTLGLSGTLAQNVAASAVLRAYTSAGVAYGALITANGSATAGATSLAVSAPSMANRAVQAGDKLRFTRGGTYNGQVGTTASNTNGTGSDVVWTTTLTLAQALVNAAAVPTSPTLTAGDALTFYISTTGQTINGTVGVGGYTADALTLPISITVPAMSTIDLPATFTVIFAVKTTTETKSITNSTTEWPDNKQLAFTWTGGLTYTGATLIEWLSSTDALLGTLQEISGVTAASTSATLKNNYLSSFTAASVLYSEPETLYCAAMVQANGSGACTIAVQTANSVSLADNSPVRIVRNTFGWIDQGAGSQTLLRASTGWLSSDAIVLVPALGSKTVWAHFAAQFWHSRNDFTNGTTFLLRLDVIDADTGAALATITSDPLPLTTSVGADRPQTIGAVVKVQTELLATTRIRVNAYPLVTAGFPGIDFSTKSYAMASYAMLTEGPDPNVPFTASSHCNTGFNAGVRYLQVYAREVRSISITVAQLNDITGMLLHAEQVVCGGSLLLADQSETLRAVSVTRDHFTPSRSSLVLETLKRNISRLLGTGTSVAGGSGAATSVGGGTSGGGASSSLTLTDDSGASIPGVTSLSFSGLGVALAALGSGGARVSIPTSVDPTGVDAVVSGGAWVTRDLVTQPGYDITVQAGSGLIAGRLVSWAQSTVTTTNVNSFVYVDGTGVVRTRAAGAPESLPTAAELLLFRTYVDVATYGNRIYAVADSRTFYRAVPRAPLFLKQRVQDSEVTSGTWNNSIAINSTGYINWYFANLGLYPFVEELPTLVKDHLDVQIAQFYGAGGTGSTDWTTLHGTTHSAGWLRWPYDVEDPRGTPVKRRADSHDAYAGTFLRLAARYAQIASGGLTWWDTNIAAIQNAAYYNIIVPVRLVNGGAGYLTDTFQDVNVYPFNQTLDNVECYRGLKDALDLMTSRGGAQATWAATYSGTPANLLSGIQSQWSASANAAGETEWLSVAYDKVSAVKLTNEMTRFYPDLSIGVPVAIYDVPLSGTDSIARDRLDKLFRWLNGKASTWFMSRKYDLYPWGMLAASAAKIGYRDLAERWLAFVQTHHAYDSPGYFLIHDVGWARYVERVLQGETLT